MSRRVLTQKSVNSLKTTKDREIVWDSEFHGGSFGVIVLKSGTKTFIYRYRNRQGEQKQISIGDADFMGLAEARAKAREHAVAVHRGTDPAEAQKERKTAATFVELVEDFRQFRMRKLKPRTAQDYELRLVRYILPAFGRCRAVEITRPQVIELLDSIGRAAPFQADRVKELIRAIFNFGIERGVVPVNPCARISPYTSDEQRRGRDRFLSEKEIKRLLVALEDEDVLIQALFKLLILTGQRIGEVTKAKWTDIYDHEIHGKVWQFSDTKSGNIQIIPLPPLACHILDSLKARNDAVRKKSRLADSSHYSIYLFPSKRSVKNGEPHINTATKACDRLEEKVGSHFTIHDLRRTAATMLRSLGVSRSTVSKVLNHRHEERGPRATERYDRYEELPEMKAALVRWAEKLSDLARSAKAASSADATPLPAL